MIGRGSAKLFNDSQQPDNNRAAAHQPNPENENKSDAEPRPFICCKNKSVRASHQSLAERKRRHQLRSRLPDKLRDWNDRESCLAQPVYNLRKRNDGSGTIAASIVQKHDVAGAGARLFDHSLHDYGSGRRRNPARLAPIMWINARAYDQIPHALRHGKQRYFVSGFRLVVDAVRRPEQQRLDSQRAVHQTLRDVQFDVNLRLGNIAPVMGVCVISDFVPFSIFPI